MPAPGGEKEPDLGSATLPRNVVILRNDGDRSSIMKAFLVFNRTLKIRMKI
jgi:hypothetical protein